MAIRNISHVIWDWNGTLLNDAYFSYKLFRSLLSERNLPDCSFDRFRQIYGHPIIDMYTRAGFDFTTESFETLAEQWHSTYTTQMCTLQLHDNAIELLDHFREAGIRQSVLSALPHSLLLQSLEDFGILAYFEKVSGLDNLQAHSKISNGIMLMSELSVNPDEVILIGDSTHDVETASCLNTHCYLVAHGLETKEKLEAHGLPVFENFSDLLDEVRG